MRRKLPDLNKSRPGRRIWKAEDTTNVKGEAVLARTVNTVLWLMDGEGEGHGQCLGRT